MTALMRLGHGTWSMRVSVSKSGITHLPQLVSLQHTKRCRPNQGGVLVGHPV